MTVEKCKVVFSLLLCHRRTSRLAEISSGVTFSQVEMCSRFSQNKYHMAKRPIKILHVVFSLEPGGMENGVVNMAKALPPEEFDIHVCCLERAGAFVARLPEPKKVYVLDKKDGFTFSVVLQLAKVIAKIRPDVVHSHNLGPLTYSGLATGFGLTRPVLQGEHSLLREDECTPRRVRHRKIFYGGCRKVHAVSEGLREQLLNLGLPAHKIVTLHNGVDSQRFVPGLRSVARQQLGLPENGFFFGVVGRFGPFKRHALCIGAFNRLAGQNRALHLLIVGGGGPEEAQIRAQAQASAARDRIHFTGFQNHLLSYYQAMDWLIVPSVNEGMSNAVLEAMSCGVPVLANNTCGNGEVIASGENGIVADLNTEEKLRDELQNVLVAQENLVKMGQMARASVVENFSMSVMASNYQRLYREVAGRRNA